MIKAVLFDVANVIIPWDPRNLYDHLITEASERDHFLNAVITRSWHERHDAGITFAENRIELMSRYPEHQAHILAWGDRFLEMFGPPISGTVGLIERLNAEQVPLFGLTNMPLEVWDGVRAMSPAFDAFADIIVSGREGVIKPSREIFEIALNRMSQTPDQVLFVDDTAVNVDAAHNLGFKTHLFTTTEELEAELLRNGLLISEGASRFKNVASPDKRFSEATPQQALP
jgi:2-haloacid dehalogenase/putative hydrolase of the HAD superfamily